MDDPVPSATPARKKLAQATAVAAAVALVVLGVAVLPAEYGVDPTGLGGFFGFARLGEDAPTIIDTSGQGSETVFAFDLAWKVREEKLFEEDGYLRTVDAQERIPVPFEGTNLTHMVATLEWTDDDRPGGEPTEPDLFELSIEAPDGRQSQSVSGKNDGAGKGQIAVSLQWRSTPSPWVDESGHYVVETGEDRSAQGTWNFLVRIYNAGGNGHGPDPGNAWNLVAKARTYGITNLGTFGSGEPGDRVTLSLEPGGSVEYKFGMTDGANLTFRWMSTAPVTFDFHGDEPGNQDAPTSHKQGVADRDEGNFTAPFAGRHGWWWHNAGPEPLTVTLTTNGQYTILGVV